MTLFPNRCSVAYSMRKLHNSGLPETPTNTANLTPESVSKNQSQKSHTKAHKGLSTLTTYPAKMARGNGALTSIGRSSDGKEINPGRLQLPGFYLPVAPVNSRPSYPG